MKTLEIHAINQFGDGVARSGNCVYVVPKTLVGDHVKVLSQKAEKRFIKVDQFELIQDSPQRTAPICKHFEKCDGCQLQGRNYENYKISKKEVLLNFHLVRDFLEGQSPEIFFGKAQGFRNQCLLHINRANRKLAYKTAYSQLMDLEECPILETPLQSILLLIHEWLNQLDPKTLQSCTRVFLKSFHNELPLIQIQGDCALIPENFPQVSEQLANSSSVILYTYRNKSDHDSASQRNQRARTIVLHGSNRDYFLDLIGDNQLVYQVGSFFQSNREISAAILKEIKKYFVENPDLVLWDLYCGLGNYLNAIHTSIKKGIGIEYDSQAIQLARKNTKRQKIENLDFYCSNLPRLPHIPEKADAWLVNPPRKGLGKTFLRQMKPHFPDSIIYVSCDPLSLQRDLKDLTQIGYKLKKCMVFDMFPWTRHFESLVFLQKNH